MSIKKSCFFLVTIWAVYGLSGCGGRIESLQLNNMVPRNQELVFSSSGKSCYLSQFEGKKDKIILFDVTTDELSKIVEDGLNHSKLFTSVSTAEKAGAYYTLSAKILGEPVDTIAGGSTVSLYVRYRLTRNDTGARVFDKRIQSVYTAPDTSSGLTRMRLAYEGATRENVKKLLEELSKIQLSGA